MGEGRRERERRGEEGRKEGMKIEKGDRRERKDGEIEGGGGGV